jgi:hypothetical protein
MAAGPTGRPESWEPTNGMTRRRANDAGPVSTPRFHAQELMP